MSLGPRCDSPVSPLGRGPVRHIAAVRVVVVEPVHWVVKCTSAAAKQTGRGEDADSAPSVLSDQISDRDAVRWGGILGAPGDSHDDLRWSVETNRTSRHVRTVALCAHNPEVAGSNPAPATNVVAGQRPFPIGRGPLACVARDQIRDQIADQRRLSRPTPSQAERRIEIRGTYCNGSGHLGRGRRVEIQRSHLGPWQSGL